MKMEYVVNFPEQFAKILWARCGSLDLIQQEVAGMCWTAA